MTMVSRWSFHVSEARAFLTDRLLGLLQVFERNSRERTVGALGYWPFLGSFTGLARHADGGVVFKIN